MISAIILTLNEEKNIVECIDCLKSWCSDIVVFDSFSTDRTTALAKDSGARVFQRKFDNYASQRNAAMREVEYPNDWVLMVDADERWGETIGKLMLKKVSDPVNDGVSIYHFQRKDMFMNTHLKHGIGAGTWTGRLLKRDSVTISREINEEYHCTGKKEYLQGEKFLHYPFNNGISWWFHRHNRYSDMEALRLISERSEKLRFSKLFSHDHAERRKQQKQLFYRLPGRPLWMFILLYIFKLGFLDGRAGFHYAVMRSIYEYMIELKISEQRQTKNG